MLIADLLDVTHNVKNAKRFKMKKDIAPINERRESHGYWEIYYDNGRIMFKGEFKNDLEVGFWFKQPDSEFEEQHIFYAR